MVRLAKRLKKEKVNVDIISFGEEVGPNRVHGGATIDTVSYIPYVLSCQEENAQKLEAFINALNSKDKEVTRFVDVLYHMIHVNLISPAPSATS